jgi:hypothetical protein
LPKGYVDLITKELGEYKETLHSFPGKIKFGCYGNGCQGHKIRESLQKFNEELPKLKQKEFLVVAVPLLELSNKYAHGLVPNKEETLCSFIKEYIDVESLYQLPRDSLLASLRQTHKGTPKKIWEIELSHNNIVEKNKLVMMFFEEIEKDIKPYQTLLTELSELISLGSREIAFKGNASLLIFLNAISS